MFKYISDILSKFSSRQRITALVILLLSIIILTFGNKVIDEFSNTDERLITEIEGLKRTNSSLSNQNDTLQKMILNNQIQCGEDIAEVRRSILEDLGLLEKQIKQQVERERIVYNKMEIQIPDSGVAMSMPIIIEPENKNTTTTMMLDGIKRLKSKIKN